ncbi:MAG: Nif3-like dinuclear metal center hexameric protein [Solirubrobacterales bacterium]
MASRDEIIGFCDRLLEINAFEDYCPNGLQVPGGAEVSKLATAVSANLETVERAITADAQLVLCHHGLFWDSQERALTVPMAARLRTLLGSNVSLAGYHLPLDAHREIGNNALLRERLGLRHDPRPFGHARGAPVGAIGTDAAGIEIGELARRIHELIGQQPLVFDSGPSAIHGVGIVSGGGAFAIAEAGSLGLDALITGEPSEPAMAEAREYGVHFIAAGHYATETLGIRRLGELLAERYRVEHTFIDVPNPV